jgi:hypothetical protein
MEQALTPTISTEWVHEQLGLHTANRPMGQVQSEVKTNANQVLILLQVRRYTITIAKL